MKALDERVQRLLDGEADPEEELALRRAIARVPAAERERAALEAGLAALRRDPVPRLPPGFEARVLARAAARPAPQRRCWLAAASQAVPAGWAWPRTAAFSCALVVVACAAGLVGYRAGADSRPGAPAALAAAAPGTPTVLVRFSLAAPAARRVELAGSFNQWGARAIALRRSPEGPWSAMVQLPRGRYEYAFVVDGERFVADSNAADFADDGFGSRNAVLDI